MNAKSGQHTGLFLKALPFFGGLAEADLDAFIAGSSCREYKKGQHIFMQGDKATRFFVIHSGWIKLYRGTQEGEEAVVALFTRGDVFGEASIFENADYPFFAVAAEEAVVIEIPAKVLQARAKGNPEISQRILASMSREMHKLQMEYEHMTLMSAAQRVGCLLLQLSAGMIGKGGTFSFPYDKSLAAQRLGMKPETFSRALAQLKAGGVQAEGGEIEIENFSKLACFSCNSCTALDKECRGARLIAEADVKVRKKNREEAEK